MKRSAITKTPKKKVLPRRVRFGIASIRMDHSDYELFKFKFKQEATPDLISKLSKEFIKDRFDKDDQKYILANPEYHFSMFADFGAAIHWSNYNKEFPERYEGYPERIKEYFGDLIAKGKKILDAKKSSTVAVNKPSPMELLKSKVNNTIMVDLDVLEDQWMSGETTEVDVYNLFKSHDLKGPATNQVRTRLEKWKLEYEDAVNKTCDDAVEAFAHIKPAELKRRIKVLNQMMEDLDKIKSATRAVRKTRAKKTITVDRQVKALKYKPSDSEYKLASIDPKLIPGAMRLLTFNVKTRTFAEFVTTSTSGFEIKGTTIQNLDPDLSRATRLRKPHEFLTVALTKTVNQINKEYQKLTTKSGTPNGRINADTILLRVFDK
jgi:hypothetical protein